MIDPSLMPPLPTPDWMSEMCCHTSEAMYAYGLQCYRIALERAAQVCETLRGNVPPHTNVHDAAVGDCAAAIRALALQEKK